MTTSNLVDLKFREWLVANYGESGAQRIISQYTRDLFLGKSSTQNKYYSVWVQRGRPGREDRQTAKLPSPPVATGAGTQQIPFGENPDLMSFGLPDTPPGVTPPTVEDAPRTGTPGYSIEQINGYDVQVFRGEDGSIIEMNVIGPSLTAGGKTAEAFYKQQVSQRGFERSLLGRQRPDSGRRDLEQQWESERGRLLQMAQGSPRDWLKAWELGQAQNPFVKQDSLLDKAKRIEEDIERREPLAKAYKKLLNLDTATLGPGEMELTQERRKEMEAYIGIVDQKKAVADVRRAEVNEQYAASVTDKPFGGHTIGSGRTSVEPQGPPTPAWLAGMFPNQATAGQPLEKFQPATPSAQWWNQAPESQRQAFLGFVDWTGGTPMDLLGNIQKQLPEPRRVPTSRPARQRTSV